MNSLNYKSKNSIRMYFLISLISISLMSIGKSTHLNNYKISLNNSSNYIFTDFTILTINDTDSDGMPDEWEIANDLDPDRDDSYFDYDLDELENLEEYQHGTDPWVEDTDGDKFNDGFEVNKGTDPADPNDHPIRVWLFVLIGMILVGIVLASVWIIRVIRTDPEFTKKDKDSEISSETLK